VICARDGLVALVAVAVLGATAPAAPAGGRALRESRCDLRDFRLFAATETTVVVRGRLPAEEPDTYLACYGRRGRPTVLGNEFFEEEVDRVQVAGRFVLARVGYCSRYDDSCESYIQITDARARRKRLYPTIGGVIRLRDDGVFAVATRLTGTVRGGVIDVGQNGRVSRLTTTEQIDASSLALSDAGVSWIDGQEPRFFALPRRSAPAARPSSR